MVPGYKRDEDPLTVMNRAQELADIIGKLTNKENIFPKKIQRTLAEPLRESTRAVMRLIMAANNYNTSIYHEVQRRIDLQYDAFDAVNSVATDLKIASSWANIDPAKLEAAFALVDSIKHLLRKWIEYSRKKAFDIENSEDFASQYIVVKSIVKGDKRAYPFASSIKQRNLPFFRQSCVSC